MKTCTKCKTELPIGEFWKSKISKDGLMYTCKKCTREINSFFRKKHKEKRNAYLREWSKRNKEKAMKYNRDNYMRHREERLKKDKKIYRDLKMEIFKAYGGKCTCCGESHLEFLSIDHIHGGGCQHRKKLGAKSVFNLLKREGFPKDKYRLLCYNCNMSMGFSGYCPHQKTQTSIT